MDKYYEEFICDMAEFYNVHEWKKIPLRTLGIYVQGLDERSRVYKSTTGTLYNDDTILLAALNDNVNLLLWGLLSKDKQRPKRILPSYLKKEPKNEQGYTTPEELKRARAQFLNKLKKHKEK